ncbi:hypothetical protein [Variovorax sp. RA8]|uniref:hypothetical protein n=1 Tax=Variovorax sp. (strain JCM 16519 / RA8) TaxID=662548 RepID=UPI0013A5A0EF|nr:hypothetical protein [Variovorax sp. RA8]
MNTKNEGTLSSLSELTEIAIQEQTESLAGLDNLPEQTMIDAVRENLGVWESKLFPLLKARRISIHGAIADLLVKSGYKNVTAQHVCVVISKVRKERSRRG